MSLNDAIYRDLLPISLIEDGRKKNDHRDHTR